MSCAGVLTCGTSSFAVATGAINVGSATAANVPFTVTGFNILRFIGYISDEILTVLGTASSESALVPLMQKLERLGCSKSVVGLVVPSGYSFNLDGTNIYLTMAALFIAQALNIDLTLRQQQLIALVAKGLTNKEIASQLNLSEFTVRNHIHRILKQLDAGSRSEAVEAIRSHGYTISL